MIKVVKLFGYHKNFGGYLPLPWAVYMYMYKIMKSVKPLDQISHGEAFCGRDVDNLRGGWVRQRYHYLTSPGCPTDIGLQLGKACYPCSW